MFRFVIEFCGVLSSVFLFAGSLSSLRVTVRTGISHVLWNSSGGGPNWICADTAARAGVRAARRAGPACSAVEETVEIESMIAD